MIRRCGICHRDRFIPDHMGACPTCLDAALTAAFGPRTSTAAELGVPSASSAAAVARPSRKDGVPLPLGNLDWATDS